MAETEDCIKEAVETIKNFVKEVTGKGTSSQEIAKALKRYFVLREISEHIKLEWENRE
ncbi:MAG: hypothetical protein GY795_18060 [Desulfobacterales bacterium]|nr:hypothetical protein [Desulfobacterales bacterium]